jgi:hypothetical protein
MRMMVLKVYIRFFNRKSIYMAEITLKRAKRRVTSVPKSKIRAAVKNVFAKYRIAAIKTATPSIKVVESNN